MKLSQNQRTANSEPFSFMTSSTIPESSTSFSSSLSTSKTFQKKGVSVCKIRTLVIAICTPILMLLARAIEQDTKKIWNVR